MTPIGIVRRIDDLGRIVIPKEFLHSLKIRSGQPFEIFIQDGGFMLLPYEPMKEDMTTNGC